MDCGVARACSASFMNKYVDDPMFDIIITEKVREALQKLGVGHPQPIQIGGCSCNH